MAGKKLMPVSRHTNPDRRRRLAGLPLWGACALLVVLSWALGSSQFFLSEPPPFDSQAAISLFSRNPMRFDHWYLADQARLSRTLNAGIKREDRRRLKAELEVIDKEISELDASPDYIHPDRGFRIYGPATTARLQALGLAAEARRELLDGEGRDALRGKEGLLVMAGYHLYPTRPSRFARVEEASRALSQVNLPNAAFRGYRVYLLPYSMGAVGGAGGPGFSIIGAAPIAVQLVSEQVSSTLTHEFGHNLSLSRMGGTYRDDPARWSRYMKLRGISSWRNSGDVNTDDWSNSTEETFAEDVRVLLGGPGARSLPFDTAYRDPRTSASTEKEITAFLRELAAAPIKKINTQPVPWLDTPVPAGAIDVSENWARHVERSVRRAVSDTVDNGRELVQKALSLAAGLI